MKIKGILIEIKKNRKLELKYTYIEIEIYSVYNLPLPIYIIGYRYQYILSERKKKLLKTGIRYSPEYYIPTNFLLVNSVF